MEYYEDFMEIDECSVKIKKLLLKLDNLVSELKRKQVKQYQLEHKEQSKNSLTQFLKSDLVILSPELYCRQKVFINALNNYCRKNYLDSFKWDNKLYCSLFSDFGLKIIDNTRKRYPNFPGNKTYTETFIVGIDVKHVDVSDDESDTELITQ